MVLYKFRGAAGIQLEWVELKNILHHKIKVKLRDDILQFCSGYRYKSPGCCIMVILDDLSFVGTGLFPWTCQPGYQGCCRLSYSYLRKSGREALGTLIPSSRSGPPNQGILPGKWHALEKPAMTTWGKILLFRKGGLFCIIHRELHESVWQMIAKTLIKYLMKVIHRTWRQPQSFMYFISLISSR